MVASDDPPLPTAAELAEQRRVLRERIKELRCLAEVASAVRQAWDGDRAGALLRVAGSLQRGFQHVTVAEARVRLLSLDAATACFGEVVATIGEPVTVDGREIGAVEVGYREERPVESEGPFLAEERDLLRTVAEILAEAAARWEAERGLQRSRELLHDLFAGHPLPILVWEVATGRLIDLNDAACRQYRAERGDLLERETLLSDLWPGVDREALAEATARGERLPDGPWRHRRRDGSELLAQVYSSLAEAAGQLIMSVVVDVTEEVRTGERLRISEQRLAEIVGSSSNVFYRHDADGVITYLSPQAAEVLGTDAELIGRRWTELLTDHPLNRIGIEATTRAVEAGVPQKAYEIQLLIPERGLVWVEVRETPVVRDGQVTEVIGSLTDITARRRAEDERALLEAELHQSQKMEALGRVAGGIAHDFNNLLTAITGFAELLLDRLDGQGEALNEVEEIRKAAERAAALTRQLLTFSRRQTLNPAEVDVNHLIADLEGMMCRLVGQGIDIELGLEQGLPAIWIDASQLEQILVNLVVNARDAMPEGGRLTITTARAGTPGDRPAEDAPPLVSLTVEDSGVGMSPEVKEHVFEPFFTTKPPGKGTGLGLATVYGIVRQSGGEIEVDSEPGRGTRVEIRLPLAGAAAGVRRRHGGETVGTRPRILIAEDETAVRELLRRVLSSRGYEVLAAAGGEEALTLAAEQPGFDALLSDVVMPDLRGPELAARLRKSRPDLPVLFISGYTGSFGSSDASDLAAGERLLRKPFSPGELLEALADLLGGEPPAPAAAAD
jgi:two-component system, cell cycle sensor histidine kinase and response regulator CckA